MTPKKWKCLIHLAWQVRSSWLSQMEGIRTIAWATASASSMRETCAQAKNNTHVDLSPGTGTMLNIIHTRAEITGLKGEAFLLPPSSIFSPLFSCWVESRAMFCAVNKSTLWFFCCSFFGCFKFCPNLQEKGTANGFVVDSTLFQATDSCSLKDSMVYQTFSLPSIHGVSEAIFKVTLLQNWQID